MGFQADRSPEADAKLEAFLADLGYRYAEETDNETYRQFLTSD